MQKAYLKGKKSKNKIKKLGINEDNKKVPLKGPFYYLHLFQAF